MWRTPVACGVETFLDAWALKHLPHPADNFPMDRRLDERYQTNLPVTVTDIAVPCRVACGQIINISRSGACATLSVRLDPGAIVKLQVGDSVLFGHVMYCDQGQPVRTYIEVVRVLLGESDLSGSVTTILLAVMPNVPGVKVISARSAPRPSS